uniref:protein-tyrosine-phosphatase n=1 Tax=Coccolithus braarudii TaxID=221442 RepID=A0A7S0LHT2_9EUKA|mmetsp:Transcript_40745/g.86850  ORF Transcript_40745/g.86850 Transcript_40745/m.86850 type:complete len:202 (+) Transcript_40745:123-728(+)|eukprot:CAMPEP_0183355804 /NCGR_PEP_ID=MMETSP0164_2-20130417/41931_1 /TAXON_ID=221442 /ORGANISM="Coccolithus pelagicus ssp braarudi, Strain PLY182g" /LENGTH=201 /DNA_ID=CAMNT_0025529033 /DNA_START=119 /DNA_END=724 /DNA_ORIENTATION=-
MTTEAAFRHATGLVRPPAGHGCPPVEIVSGLWTAHFHDVDTPEKLQAVSPGVRVVVNAGTDKCPLVDYGPGVDVVMIDGLLDDPDALKRVDAMSEGPEKDASRATLPDFAPEECAGDAKRDFDRVNEIIDATRSAGGSTLIHCHASLSRSVVFILAYLVKTRGISAVEAVGIMKPKWDACWPNKSFVKQLLAYEAELRSGD